MLHHTIPFYIWSWITWCWILGVSFSILTQVFSMRKDNYRQLLWTMIKRHYPPPLSSTSIKHHYPPPLPLSTTTIHHHFGTGTRFEDIRSPCSKCQIHSVAPGAPTPGLMLQPNPRQRRAANRRSAASGGRLHFPWRSLMVMVTSRWVAHCTCSMAHLCLLNAENFPLNFPYSCRYQRCTEKTGVPETVPVIRQHLLTAANSTK